MMEADWTVNLSYLLGDFGGYSAGLTVQLVIENLNLHPVTVDGQS
jgi:hypothetical protein